MNQDSTLLTLKDDVFRYLLIKFYNQNGNKKYFN